MLDFTADKPKWQLYVDKQTRKAKYERLKDSLSRTDAIMFGLCSR